MRRIALALALAVAIASPLALADAPGPKPPAKPMPFNPFQAPSQTPSKAPDAGVPQSPEIAVSAFADLQLRWHCGRLGVEGTARGRYVEPQKQRRYRGRFEARIRGAGRVLEVFDLDLPGLAEADPGAEAGIDERVRAGMTTRATVRVPLPDGTDEILILDRRGSPSLTVPVRPASAAPAPKAPPPPPAPRR